MKILDELINERYEKYYNIAKNILGKAGRFANMSDRAYVMVNEAYIHVATNISSDNPKFLESCLVNTMHKQVHWKGGPLPKEYINSQEYIIDESSSDEGAYDEEDHTRRIMHIHNRVARLDHIGQRLYELAIVGEYNNAPKLSKHIQVPKTTAYYLIRDLKKYLKDGYDNN